MKNDDVKKRLPDEARTMMHDLQAVGLVDAADMQEFEDLELV